MEKERETLLAPILIGLLAGVLSGLLGVGGGIVMVPMLVLIGLTQHRSHATSLAAIVPIATVGALAFALERNVALSAAIFLALGSLLGAPLGARIMARSSEGLLKLMFGALMLAVGLQLVWP